MIETKAERNRRYQIKYKQRHPERVKKYQERYRRANPEKKLWHKAKHRAKKSGLAFDITPTEVVIPDKCPVLGIPIKPGVGKVHDNSPSLDRVDPDKGYVTGNVAVISYKANRYKNDMSLDVVKRLLNYMTEQARKD